MAAEGYTTRKTFGKVGTLLDNPLYLLERLNDSRATVFLLLREVSQPIHVSEIIKRTRVSRRQVYRALQFLKSIDLADDVHGYWYEKMTRQL
jgi:DNA invertase Pin-like site-specific DNA recombinase